MSSVYWSDGISALDPYVPGEQPRIANLVKLNTNENPYPPSPQVFKAIETTAQKGLQLYPDPHSQGLRQAIADHHSAHGLTPDHIFVGNGSDEVLAHAFRAFFVHGKSPLLMPDISYSFYKVYSNLFGIEARLIPLTEDWRINVADYAHFAQEDVAGVIIANPNAPTGVALELQQVKVLLDAFPQRLVLLDEAYVDFGAESALSLIAQYPNLLVVHTLSKSRSLAGLRVGFAAGQPHLIEALTRVKDSFNSYPLDRLASAGAIAAYQDHAYFAKCVEAIKATRTDLIEQLRVRGFEVLPSAANFVFARHPQHAGGDIFAALRRQGVLVRHFAKPRIADFLRITVGLPEQSAVLLAALDSFLDGEN